MNVNPFFFFWRGGGAQQGKSAVMPIIDPSGIFSALRDLPDALKRYSCLNLCYLVTRLSVTILAYSMI